MDNYANTPGPDKKSAKIIISNKLKKNKSNWNYVSESIWNRVFPARCMSVTLSGK